MIDDTFSDSDGDEDVVRVDFDLNFTNVAKVSSEDDIKLIKVEKGKN